MKEWLKNGYSEAVKGESICNYLVFA